MESLRALYRIGTGPSSSHTLAPRAAAFHFKQKWPKASSYRVTLFGSLAATGRGHLTDVALASVLSPLDIVFRPQEVLPFHPNGMRFEAFDDSGSQLERWEAYSVGGGAYLGAEQIASGAPNGDLTYEFSSMETMLEMCDRRGCGFFDLAFEREDKAFPEFLSTIWKTMQETIRRGLRAEGALPGPLGVSRKAFSYYRKGQMNSGMLRRTGRLSSYALAVSEENASAGIVVTAPTCGSSGVVPAVLRYLKETMRAEEESILKALATAGLVGNLVKHNASISGAAVGCQGEIGTACAMAAAAAAQLFGGTPGQIEYAAEMALEHHLGLTCDPVLGLVQIPCIERNAMAAARALTAAEYAILSDGRHHISFDTVVATMKRTGHDLPSLYRETALGGLAVEYDAGSGGVTAR
ncbi:MAG TPA: L-serine ammonia-lyase [Spirochaetia bacterium]|nr:L-serine ammonia-lyase [Spirochaetia bacterium]